MAMNPRLLRPLATGFNPRQISGLALWLDAADSTTLFQNSDGTTPATSANDPVGYWRDKSGNNRHATQATAGNRPAYAGSMNGRGVLTFDGTSDRLLGSVPAITALPATIIAVARPTAGVQNRYLSPLFGQKSGANFRAVLYRGFNAVTLGGWLDNLRLYNGGAGNLSSLTPWPTNTAAVVGTLIASPAASHRIYYQGLETPLAESTNADTPAGSYYIGADPDNTSAPVFWTGQYAELVVYARALTTAERQRVEGYLARKWGITLAPQVSNADAQDWVNRVYSNGGTVSTSTATAVNDFCNAIDAAGIRDRFYRLNLFAGTGLNACLVPLYRGQSRTGTQFGNSTDTNNGPFVSGDYVETGSTGGLNGNGTSKYLATGLNPFDAGMVETDFHASGYFKDAINTSGVFVGCVNATAQRGAVFHPAFQTIGMYVRFGGLFNSGIENGTLSARSGLLLGVRNPSGAGYRNGANINAASNTTGSFSWNESAASPALFVFARNDTQASPSIQAFSGRAQAYSIGRGMTDAQASSFWDAMQKFQTTLGRNV